MSELLRQIEENIRAQNLLRRNERVLVAVSGGLDSMVLLHLFDQLSKTHGWKITVAHFNHQLRGRSSDADERLVEKTAHDLKLKCVVDRADVKAFAKKHRLSIEMAARKLRHGFFARAAKKLKLKTVALAHHADDQVELFFLRLLRGAGTEGLSGMNWKSDSPADSSLQLIRPLLNQSKEFLVEFAKAKKIRFREDASNASPEFLRNRIRIEVVPLLKSIQPALNDMIHRTMEIASQESRFVLAAAKDWLNDGNRVPFERLHLAVQRVCLRLQMRSLSVPADFQLIEQLRLQPDRPFAVDSKRTLSRDKAGSVHVRELSTIAFSDTETKVVLSEKKEIEFSNLRISWEFLNAPGSTLTKKSNCEFFDADKVGERIILRHWRAGDRFQPIGTKSPRKLQDIFTNLKIPRNKRLLKTIAVTERGEIFWVEGLRISERFKLDNASKRRLKWAWQCRIGAVAGGIGPC